MRIYWLLCELKVMQYKRRVSWLRLESQSKSIKAVLDVHNVKTPQLWCCLWLVRAPGLRVLASAIIFCSLGSGCLWWTVCFHAFQSSPVSWPVTQLSSRALRPCTFGRMCVYVCTARMWLVSLHLSPWTLTPSLINVRGLRQALHAAFRCDRQILGLCVTPGVRVGTMRGASTKTALPLIKQTCAIHTASALLKSFERSTASGSVDATGTTPLFWSWGLGG